MARHQKSASLETLTTEEAVRRAATVMSDELYQLLKNTPDYEGLNEAQARQKIAQSELVQDLLSFVVQQGTRPDRGYHNLWHFLELGGIAGLCHDLIYYIDCPDAGRPITYLLDADGAPKKDSPLNHIIDKVAQLKAPETVGDLSAQVKHQYTIVTDEFSSEYLLFQSLAALGVRDHAILGEAAKVFATTFNPVEHRNDPQGVRDHIIGMAERYMEYSYVEGHGLYRDNPQALISEEEIGALVTHAKRFDAVDIEGYINEQISDAAFFGISDGMTMRPGAGTIGVTGEAFRQRYPEKTLLLGVEENWMHHASPMEVALSMKGSANFNYTRFSPPEGRGYVEFSPHRKENDEGITKARVAGEVQRVIAGLGIAADIYCRHYQQDADRPLAEIVREDGFRAFLRELQVTPPSIAAKVTDTLHNEGALHMRTQACLQTLVLAGIPGTAALECQDIGQLSTLYTLGQGCEVLLRKKGELVSDTDKLAHQAIHAIVPKETVQAYEAHAFADASRGHAYETETTQRLHGDPQLVKVALEELQRCAERAVQH